MADYENPPSRRQLKKSGTEDWFNDAIAEQKRRDDALAGVFGEVAGDLDRSKSDLLSAFSELPEEEDPEEPAPDLFSNERDSVEQKRAQAQGMFAESEETRAEKERLRNLFG